MVDYLTKFKKHSDYAAVKSTLRYPNVSYCVQEDEVHYSVSLLNSIPSNIIKYYSTIDLTNNNYSINMGAFSNDEDDLNIVSYTYDSESQLSVMEFDKDILYIYYAFVHADSDYIERIELPSSIESINGQAFSGALSLQCLVMYSSVPPTITGNESFYLPQYCEIYVPDRAVNSYKNAPAWEDYASNIYPLSELEEYEPIVNS